MKKPARRVEAAPLTLNETTLAQGLKFLSRRDPDLAKLYADFGTPPLWSREPGFPTLIHTILGQQVSLAAALSAFNRLLDIASPLTPRALLALDDATLKAVGFSRQKTVYARELAAAIVEGRLDLEAFRVMDDAAVRSELVKLKGIGPWTADIYLLMALKRPDVWPSGDLAIAVAAHEVKRLAARPSPAELDRLSTPWQPWRAVAARLLWSYYLARPRAEKTRRKNGDRDG